MKKLERTKCIISLAVCMLSIVSLPAGAATATLNGHVDFEDYACSNWLLPVGVQFMQNGVILRTERVFLDAANNFNISEIDAGTYDVAFNASGFLRKVVLGVQFNSGVPVPVNAALENGDLNGDNSVGLSDLSILSAKHGQQGH